MAKLDDACLIKVEDALDDYKEVVEATSLAPDTKRGYILQAEAFVRWLDDKFTPGERKREQQGE